MLRYSFRELVNAASSSATRMHSERFLRRLSELERCGDGLGCSEYKFLRSELATYKKLQGRYGVKQTDVERARLAARQCGLEFTGKGERKTVPRGGETR